MFCFDHQRLSVHLRTPHLLSYMTVHALDTIKSKVVVERIKPGAAMPQTSEDCWW